MVTAITSHQLHQVVIVTFAVDDAEGSELVVICTTSRKYVIHNPNSCNHNTTYIVQDYLTIT